MFEFLNRLVRTFCMVAIGGCLLFSSGCGAGVPYPDAAVTSPLGEPSECSVCRTSIPTVEERNLHAFQGIQHIVCSEACKPVLEEQILRQ